MLSIQIQDSDILCYANPERIKILEGAFITGVNGKWILKSNSILTRCGCSKSFSIRSGNPIKDKIQLLKSKLSKKPKHKI